MIDEKCARVRAAWRQHRPISKLAPNKSVRWRGQLEPQGKAWIRHQMKRGCALKKTKATI
jgi:hypothetical protein